MSSDIKKFMKIVNENAQYQIQGSGSGHSGSGHSGSGFHQQSGHSGSGRSGSGSGSGYSGSGRSGSGFHQQSGSGYSGSGRSGDIYEKWGTTTTVNPAERGKYHGKTKSELLSAYNKLKASGPHHKGSPAYGRMRELAFAIRAKSDWGKVNK